MRSYAGRGVGAHFINDLFLAEKYVYVVSRWISPEYARKLVEKAESGVEVKVLTSDDSEKSHQESLKILLDALKPPKLAFFRKSWTPVNMELGVIREKYLHVKMYVWDRGAAVGSANFTQNGMWHNIEHIIVFDKQEEIEAIKKDFNTLWTLYTEDKETAKEVITLFDIAKKIGKPLSELKKLFRKE
ncbi:MAG: phospholipase D-like domain-containing protein [Desulfurococcales archaeon]|nr:phospholipase D-like domain-containing protein [Desulfurococcales archaeon]